MTHIPEDGEGRADRTTGRGDAPVLALVADLFFAARVKGTAEAAGVRARTVGTARDLLHEARAERPRLVLVDLDARGVDAPALIGELKSDPELAPVPVVAFGSHVRRAALVAARSAGADRVLARSAFVRELPALLRVATETGGAGS